MTNRGEEEELKFREQQLKDDLFFYKPSQVGKMFQVHRDTVLKWLYLGKIKGNKLGEGKQARWYISAQQIRDFVARGNR